MSAAKVVARPFRRAVLDVEDEDAAGPSTFLAKLFKFGALPITLVSVILTLSSYGFVLGLLDPFHGNPEQLRLGAFDYLERSYRPIILGIHFAGERASLSALYAWVESIWWQFWPISFSVSLLYVGLIYVAANDKKHWHALRAIVALSRKWSCSVRARLLAYTAPVLTPAFFLLSVTGVGVALWVAFVMFLVVISFVPALGAIAGLAAAKENIIEPLRCRSAAIRESNRTGGARCVRIVLGDTEIARGRFVEQGADRILLYRKASDSLISVPTEKSLVEDVSTE